MLHDIEDIESTVIQAADAAMYHVKTTGKNSYLFFDAKSMSSSTARIQTKSDLRQSPLNGKVFLV